MRNYNNQGNTGNLNYRLLSHLKGEKYTLIDPKDRDRTCDICGIDKSVKYKITKMGSVYHICNKCVIHI